MYEKNLSNRAALTPEFQNGVTTFIKWAKSQQTYMDGEKIMCPCRKCKKEVFKTLDKVNFDLYMKDFMPEYYNWTSHGDKRVQEYFEAVTRPILQDEQNPPALVEEGTNTHWGHAAEMNWAKRMIFDAAGQAYNQDGAADDGMRSCPLDATEQPLWNGCTTSQLAVVAELVDIKIDACKNSCMLYWKDGIDMDYCKFCRESRYKLTRERNLKRKRTPYAVLRYLAITPPLQRLYASHVTAEQMTWHANH
ncbi:UNVERIFIED_CONTAM: hypothetical protein Sradi_6926000 [Sesamum radiatum]|uniref:Transposase-associated domain-containing protein n=1 Tax=Sesamum radiatum TaxID=300843 RepID=A0AAW2JGV4_SESRA